MTSEDVTCSLSRLANDEPEDRSTDTDARGVNVTRLSSAHKHIADGSSCARRVSTTFAPIASPEKLAKHLHQEQLDQLCHFSNSPTRARWTQATSTCSSFSQRSTRSLSCKQFNGYRRHAAVRLKAWNRSLTEPQTTNQSKKQQERGREGRSGCDGH